MEAQNPQDLWFLLCVLLQVYQPLPVNYGWMKDYSNLPFCDHLLFYHGESLVTSDHNILPKAL